MKMNKRTLFKLTGGITSALLLGYYSSFRLLDSDSFFCRISMCEELPSGLKELLNSLDGTDEIAVKWLEEPGLGLDSSQLVSRLLVKFGNVTTHEEYQNRSSQIVKEEYRRGQICKVDGWHLSETECELAALRFLEFGPIDNREGKREKLIAHTSQQGGELVERSLLKIANWGPRSTEQSIPFNVQPDGHSGLWFSVVNAPPWIKVIIAGVESPTTVQERVVTSGLMGEHGRSILNTPGEYNIELYDPMTGRSQLVGQFVVSARTPRATLADGATAVHLCSIESWGPTSTRVGVPENPQPNGSMGLWFKSGCSPVNGLLKFDGHSLPITRTEFGFTCSVPVSMIENPRSVDVSLVDKENGQSITIGKFDIF